MRAFCRPFKGAQHTVGQLSLHWIRPQMHIIKINFLLFSHFDHSRIECDESEKPVNLANSAVLQLLREQEQQQHDKQQGPGGKFVSFVLRKNQQSETSNVGLCGAWMLDV